MPGKGKWFAGPVAIFVLLSWLTGPAAAQQKAEPKAGEKVEQKAGEKVEKKAEPKPKAEQKAEPKTGKEKFGKGEIKIAEDLVEKARRKGNTTVTVDQLLEMRKAGKGWGQIAKELGVEMGKGGQEKPGKKARAEKRAEKEEKKEKPEKGEKKEK